MKDIFVVALEETSSKYSDVYIPCLPNDINLKNLWLKRMERQEQSPRVVLLKRCSCKFRKIHRKAPVPESLLLKKTGTGVFL